MSENKFQPIFDYMDQKISELKEDLSTIFANKEDFRSLQKSVDGIAKNLKDKDQELTVTQARVKHIENWVVEVADKTEIPYNPNI